MKKRGRKAAILTIEDKVLLTVTYLRHYPTFDQLGDQFGICESYAHKVFQQYLDRLVTVCHVPGKHVLLNQEIAAIIVDVTEQPMERPTHHQGDWYSGKKTTPHQRPIDRLALQSPDCGGRVWQMPYP